MLNIYVHTHVRSMMHTHVRSMCCAPINECFELAPYKALRSVASAVQCSAAVRMLHSGEPGNKHGLAALHCCLAAAVRMLHSSAVPRSAVPRRCACCTLPNCGALCRGAAARMAALLSYSSRIPEF